MKKIIHTTLIIAVIFFVLPTSSSAQITFRNPINITPTKSLNLFDNDNNILGKKTIYDCTVLSASSLEDNHRGVDFTVPTGTSVYAAGAGRITYTNTDIPLCDDVGFVGNKCGGGFGNHYYIDHTADTADNAGLISIYAHMKKGSLTTAVGTPVACGQQIAQSASSGSSSGPHLHFEFRNNGASIDPFVGSCSHSQPPPSWTSVNSGQPTTTCDNHPLVPSNVVVSSSTPSSLAVTFKDNALNETNILFERKIGTGGSWVSGSIGVLTGAGSWILTNTSLWPGTTYCYRFQSQNGTLYSTTYSNEACGTTLSTAPIPLAPSNVIITNATTNSLRVNFKDNATDETNILVERKISVASGTWIQVASFGALTGTSNWYWTNTGLASQTNFCYRLRAITATGSSAYSSQACGTTL